MEKSTGSPLFFFCFVLFCFVSDIIIIIIIIIIICLNSNIFFLGQNTLSESGSAVLQTISAEKPDERMSRRITPVPI